MILGVPILKHFRVPWFNSLIDSAISHRVSKILEQENSFDLATQSCSNAYHLFPLNDPLSNILF